MANRRELLILAEHKLNEVLKILKLASKDDTDGNVAIGSVNRSAIELSYIIEKYEGEKEDIGGDHFFETDNSLEKRVSELVRKWTSLAQSCFLSDGDRGVYYNCAESLHNNINNS